MDTCNAGAGHLAVTIDGPSKVSMDCTEVEEGYKVKEDNEINIYVASCNVIVIRPLLLLSPRYIPACTSFFSQIKLGAVHSTGPRRLLHQHQIQ